MGEFPNKATQFPVNRKDHTTKGPYFKPLIEKILEKEINFLDPVTQEKMKLPAGAGLIYRKIWNGLEGNGKDIEDIIDRVDGKVTQKSEIEHSGTVNVMPLIIKDGKPLEHNVGSETA